MKHQPVKNLPNLCLFCALLFVATGCNTLPHMSSMQSQGSWIPAAQASTYQASTHQNFPTGRPVDFQDFKTRYRSIGTSPEGAVRMYFDAVFSYIDPARKSEGSKMLRYSLHERQNWESFPTRGTFVSRLKDPSFHHIFRSFAEGTSSHNNYAMNPDNYRLVFAGTRQESDYVKILLRSSGADSPRPLHVQQFEDGLWYVTNNHSTYVEVRRPSSQIRTGGHDADLD